jgi:hypothetical protein
MTIDTEKLRALLAAATPGPWREWQQHESTRCVWKDTLPHGSACIESTGTVFALGVAVAATPDDGPDAALIAAAVNALPELLNALATAEATIKTCDDVLTVEFCLPWHKEPLPERVRRAQRNAIDEWQAEEAAHKATKARLATAEAERLTLARAYATGETFTEAEQFDAADLAARIVAEADAEARRG